jgi:hypothetical protein
VYASFSVPLLGCLNSAKLVPLFVDDLELDLTFNQSAQFITQSNASLNISYQILDITLQYDVLTLESAGFQQLVASYGGMMDIKTQSYKFGASTLPAQLSRSQFDIVYSHNVSSLKRWFMSVQPNGLWESAYGSVNPNLSSLHLVIGSTSYPQNRMDTTNVAETFTEVQKAFGSLNSVSHTGSMNRQSFAKASVASNASSITREYATYTTVPTAGQLQASSFTASQSNKCFFALDLESINQIKNNIYSGINSKGSTNSIVLSVGETLANQAHTAYYFSEYDCILKFDGVNEMIVVSE